MVPPTHCAFVTFLMLNESYLPGALLQGYSLAQQVPDVSRVCLVTEEVSSRARTTLGTVFDHIVPVEKIYVPHRRRQKRQDRPYLLTRLQALRLGPDGDLGYDFKRIVVLDADILPLKRLDQLFLLRGPAGVLNESKSHLIATDTSGRYMNPPDVDPSLAALCATHFAGIKPWAFRNPSWKHYSQFPDFRYWHRQFLDFMARSPDLSQDRRLSRLADAILGLRRTSAR